MEEPTPFDCRAVEMRFVAAVFPNSTQSKLEMPPKFDMIQIRDSIAALEEILFMKMLRKENDDDNDKSDFAGASVEF